MNGRSQKKQSQGTSLIESEAAAGKQAENTWSREEILEIALDEFGRHGYDGVSVREVNRRLGASHNLVHYHFGSKMALWQAAVDMGFDRIAKIWLVSAPISPENTADALRDGFKKIIEMTAKNPATQRVIDREAAVGGERLNYIVEKHMLPHLENGSRYFSTASKFGEGGLNLASAVLMIMSGASTFFTQAALARKIGGPDPFSEEGLEKHIKTITELFLYGMLGKNPDDKAKKP